MLVLIFIVGYFNNAEHIIKEIAREQTVITLQYKGPLHLE